MKLFIEDKVKLNKYELPTNTEESFLITYKSEETKMEYSINIESEDNEWYIKSNGIVDVLENGVLIEKAPLKNYYSYVLNIMGESDYRILYCFPFMEEKSLDASVFGVNNVTIGSNVSCNIVYNNPNLEATHAVINNTNMGYVISTTFDDVYVNSKPTLNHVLKIGDTIFIKGLKIVWMNTFVRICNLPDDININGLAPYKELEKYDYTKHGSDDDKDTFMRLYDPKDYFFHTPRIRNYIKKEHVKIDEPPTEEKIDRTPVILTIGTSLTMVASSFMTGYTVIYGMTTGTKTIATAIPSIMMCVCILIGGLIMPKVLASYQKKKKIARENLRQKKYGEYLVEKNNEIKGIINKQSMILNYNFPSSSECVDVVLNRKPTLWSKQIIDDDFLHICLGYGSADAQIEFNAPEAKFSIEEDNLRSMVVKLADDSKTINNIPVYYSLLENRLSAVICNMPNKVNYINSLLLQIITFHSAADLKLVFFVEQFNEDDYDYAKYLPHVISEDKQMRFFATDYTESKEISEYLDNLYKERIKYVNSPNKDSNTTIDKTNKYKNFDTYYLIVTDCYSKIKDINFIKNLIKAEDNYGFSCLFVGDGLSDLPAECKTFSYVNEANSFLVKPVEKENETKYFTIKNDYYIDMAPIVYKLANIPIAAKEGKKELPTSLTFLDMYNVSKIEQLNILNKWQQNDPVTSLKAPIGVHTDGELFMLDLHEKAHGPHGLIAGMTGSGKSEFIITFILSMAINYNPNEVQFVLIDYKGGGLAGAFENRETGASLPHLAGTITNLDTAEMNRTLVSINSELKRRQRVFNEVRDRLGEGTIDIYKYQRLYREGAIEDPVAHLYIVSDEFAELKSQQPEFMQELISTARIGRSLGVHLILATQKPSGVVNDQIWANSKFKVCLKVQDRSDSMEMLKKPDAASLKEAGRFYLQVGYDEYYDIGQSGYSGVQYIPSDTVIKKVDNNINYISNTGTIIKSINDDEKKKVVATENKGDQLTNIVKYIISLARKQQIMIKKLWLNSIAENITLEVLHDKYYHENKEYYIDPVIGEYDNPSKQEQGLLTIDLTGKGHTLIYGMAGSGKENLLTTLITSTVMHHSPDEVNFYIMDFGAETLRIFSKFPHVGCVATGDEEAKIMDTLVLIDEEAGRRRDLFVDYAGSYQNYIKESGEKLPLIVVVINGYETFIESYPRLAEAMYPLIREGSKYGIAFVFTSATNSAIKMRTAQLFINRLTLQQNNPDDYRSVVGSPRGMTPKKYFGRGIVATDDGALEFQTAYVCEKDKINARLRELSKELQEKYTSHAKRIIVVPDVVTTNIVEQEKDGLNIPIGIDKNVKDTYLYDFDKNAATLVLSNNIDDKTDFIYAITKMISTTDNTEVKIIDPKSLIQKDIENVEVLNSDFDLVLSDMIKDINKEADGIKRVFVILGFNSFKESISKEYSSYFDSMISNINKFNNSKLIIVDDNESFKNIQTQDWYNDLFDGLTGIWLGPAPMNQMVIRFNNISPEDRNDNSKYIAFVNDKGKSSTIKYVVEGDNNG